MMAALSCCRHYPDTTILTTLSSLLANYDGSVERRATTQMAETYVTTPTATVMNEATIIVTELVAAISKQRNIIKTLAARSTDVNNMNGHDVNYQKLSPNGNSEAFLLLES